MPFDQKYFHWILNFKKYYSNDHSADNHTLLSEIKSPCCDYSRFYSGNWTRPYITKSKIWSPFKPIQILKWYFPTIIHHIPLLTNLLASQKWVPPLLDLIWLEPKFTYFQIKTSTLIWLKIIKLHFFFFITLILSLSLFNLHK